MGQALEQGGLRISAEVDLSDASIAFRSEMAVRAERGELPLTAPHVIMGDEFADAARNMGRCVVEKRVVEHFILAEKP
jgi:hypothetical protein